MPTKSKMKISQNFVAFSEYINFTKYIDKSTVEISKNFVAFSMNFKKAIFESISPHFVTYQKG